LPGTHKSLSEIKSKNLLMTGSNKNHSTEVAPKRILSGSDALVLSANRLEGHAIVLFDGVCNLCNGSINFVIDHDPEGFFKFASLQSDEAGALLAKHHLSTNYVDSIILVSEGIVFARSDAILNIAKHLPGAWSLLWGFKVIPRRFRDLVYDWIARNRYKWFGKRDFCRVPTPELRARFL